MSLLYKVSVVAIQSQRHYYTKSVSLLRCNYDTYVSQNYRPLVHNIISLIGLFCRRDLWFYGAYCCSREQLILIIESTALHSEYIRLLRHWLRIVVEQILEAISKNFWHIYTNQHTKIAFLTYIYEIQKPAIRNSTKLKFQHCRNLMSKLPESRIWQGLQKSAIRNSKVSSTECATCNDDDLFENSRYCSNSQKNRRSCINRNWGYGVAAMSRLIKIAGLFCRISSRLRVSFAKETYNFMEPTNRSHPIHLINVHYTTLDQRTLLQLISSGAILKRTIYSHFIFHIQYRSRMEKLHSDRPRTDRFPIFSIAW